MSQVIYEFEMMGIKGNIALERIDNENVEMILVTPFATQKKTFKKQDLKDAITKASAWLNA